MGPLSVTEPTDRRAALRRAIADDEARLRRAVRDLRVQVKQRTDIAQHIQRRPYPWLIGAFAVGMWLGARR